MASESTDHSSVECERPGLSGALLRFGATLADFVFPRLCCGCGERVIETGRLICIRCEETIEDLVLPLCPTCGVPAARGGDSVCDDCPRGTVHFNAARGTTPFTGIAKTLVEKLKYSGRVEYAPVMAQRMAEVSRREFRDVAFDGLLPVPLHSTRYRDRGFNQSEEIAGHLSRMTGLPVLTGLLKRARPTPSQTKLKRKERAENIKDAFQCPDPAQVAHKRVLLVDDVYTTGATLNECARTLTENGALSVHCLAYARAVLGT